MDTILAEGQPRAGLLKGLIEQFGKFILVGIMNTLVDLMILNIEMAITGVVVGAGYSVEKAVSFIFAVTFSYFINKRWTFQDRSKEGEGKKMSQFFAVSFVGMLINVTIATVVVTYLQVPLNNILHLAFLTPKLWGTIGALGGTAIGLFWNFIGYKFIVFKK